MINDRVDSKALAQAGIEAMSRAGRPLAKIPSKGRSMLYQLANGETVRIRTCNDHVLIIVADRPTPDATLNVEGTDWLLVVMPEVERTPGAVIVYFLPVREVEEEARRTHQAWLEGNPNTKGDNRTWNLWFRRDAPGKASDYATKWAHYKLDSTLEVSLNNAPTTTQGATAAGNVKNEVETARKRIAAAAGVSIDAVKITISFEG